MTDKIQNTVFNEDCIQGMKMYPDKHFDWAIVDPPYGIGWDGGNDVTKKGRPDKFNRSENPKYTVKDWDEEKPTAEYWDQLFRVSKNQIVWGGNYFTEYLNPKKCWVFWDKLYDKTFNFSHGELAWTSLDTRMLKVAMSSKIETCGGLNKIHPCQKPVKLYKWLMNEFCKEGDLILDTHIGSGSSRIAAHIMKMQFVGFEIDKDYFEAQEKRFKDFKSQLTLDFK